MRSRRLLVDGRRSACPASRLPARWISKRQLGWLHPFCAAPKFFPNVRVKLIAVVVEVVPMDLP